MAHKIHIFSLYISIMNQTANILLHNMSILYIIKSIRRQDFMKEWREFFDLDQRQHHNQRLLTQSQKVLKNRYDTLLDR